MMLFIKAFVRRSVTSAGPLVISPMMVIPERPIVSVSLIEYAG